MEPKHAKLVTSIGAFYCCVNLMATKTRNKPLYWFLTWKDYKSPLICFIICVLANFSFKLLSSFTSLAKPHMSAGFKESMWDFPEQDIQAAAKKIKNSGKNKKRN